jgi:hypothetical protein
MALPLARSAFSKSRVFGNFGFVVSETPFYGNDTELLAISRLVETIRTTFRKDVLGRLRHVGESSEEGQMPLLMCH